MKKTENVAMLFAPTFTTPIPNPSKEAFCMPVPSLPCRVSCEVFGLRPPPPHTHTQLTLLCRISVRFLEPEGLRAVHRDASVP